MKELALTLPGSQTISPPAGFENSGIVDLGSFISTALNLAILVAAILMFFWMIWGIFQYIYAGGDKENLGKARSRITLAIVGFIITLLALFISQFAGTVIHQRENQPVRAVPTPRP